MGLKPKATKPRTKASQRSQNESKRRCRHLGNLSATVRDCSRKSRTVAERLQYTICNSALYLQATRHILVVVNCKAACLHVCFDFHKPFLSYSMLPLEWRQQTPRYRLRCQHSLPLTCACDNCWRSPSSRRNNFSHRDRCPLQLSPVQVKSGNR